MRQPCSAQICGAVHAEIHSIVREEVAARRLKNGEGSTRHEHDRREEQQRPAVADRCLQEAVIVVGQNKILTGRNAATAKYGSSRRPSSGQL